MLKVTFIPKYTFHHTTPVHRKLSTYFQYNKMRKISLRFPFQHGADFITKLKLLLIVLFYKL